MSWGGKCSVGIPTESSKYQFAVHLMNSLRCLQTAGRTFISYNRSGGRYGWGMGGGGLDESQINYLLLHELASTVIYTEGINVSRPPPPHKHTHTTIGFLPLSLSRASRQHRSGDLFMKRPVDGRRRFIISSGARSKGAFHPAASSRNKGGGDAGRVGITSRTADIFILTVRGPSEVKVIG